MYCRYSRLSLLFLKIASQALLVWFLFLEDPNEVNPINRFISYSASSTYYTYYAFYTYSFYGYSRSPFSASSLEDLDSALSFFLSRDRDRECCSPLEESSLIYLSLARRALRSICLLDSLI
jgi:hypothetical protein